MTVCVIRDLDLKGTTMQIIKYTAYVATTLAVTVVLSGCLHNGIAAAPV